MPYKAKTRTSALGLASVLSVSIFLSCAGGERNSSSYKVPPAPVVYAPTSDAAQSVEDAVPGPNARSICKRPNTLARDPDTFEELIALLNELPKPVSAACLLDTLDRPLKINAVLNTFSGQPGSAGIPRIFVMVGKNLVLSVVASGSSSTSMEMGVRVGENRSIRGEIPFPVTEKLSPSAAYTTVNVPTNEGTFCATCHVSEQPEPSISDFAFSSVTIVPSPAFRFPLEKLEALNEACTKEKSDECPVIQSMFRGQKPVEKEITK